VSEESPSCGQCGRLCRVFWRDDIPWVLVRLRDGVMQSLPWAWTNLPVASAQHEPQIEERATVLLSPMALRELVRRVRELRERDHAGCTR
jgi:hypothetical protein